MNELEFARERHRQLLMVMHLLMEEATAKAKTKKEAEAATDLLLDHILRSRAEIKRLENSEKN